MAADFAQLRTNMVDGQLRTTDVTQLPVLAAMGRVPREEFVPAARRSVAYIDEDIAVAAGRYIMEPSPFAKLLQLANIKADDFVLDIGCATGYSAAVISQLASSVIALEEDKELADRAQETLSELGYDNVAVVNERLEAGCASEAPFDVIVLEGAIGQIPDTIFQQLREGGRLVAVEGTGASGAAWLYIKENGGVSRRRGFNCAIKPLPGFRPVESFVF